jgi:YrbI family 3-deoxy-D-manno-octulosonate 8-phosphate phosphatase
MNIAFVPVRGGSKSIPLKNIKMFCGRPLVFWCLDALQKSIGIDQIFVATDCDEIKRVVNDFKLSKVTVYDRSDEHAQDQSSTEAVMLEFLNERHFEETDLFLLVQATSPLTETADFERALEILKSEKSESLLTCVRTKSFFWGDDGAPINYEYLKRPRRQDFDGTLVENGAFYINTVGSVIRGKNRLSGKISIYEMEDFKAVEIDEPDDWTVAENMMRKHILTSSSGHEIKLFLSDVDGTLTDASMYYSESGEELKKFNTHDGKGFELLRKVGVKTGIITSENTKIVANRAAKLKVDYLFQGLEHQGKLATAQDLCRKEGIELVNVAYIGDDVNCRELLEAVGYAACPSDAIDAVKQIPNILCLSRAGGRGCVREFADLIISRRVSTL